MKLHNLFINLLLAHACRAGFVIVAITLVAEALEEAALIATATAEAVSAAVLDSGIAAAFGVGASEVFFGDAVIVNGALYYASNAVGAGVLAGGAAGIGGGTYKAVTDKKESAALLKSISSASVASVSSVSVESVASVSHSSATEYLSKVENEALASNAVVQAAAETYDNTASDPFPDIKNTQTKRSDQPVSTARASVDSGRYTAAKRSDQAATTGTLPPPPGAPYSTVPPEAQRTPEIPAGVPEYNFRMCQYDIIKMNQTGLSLLFDQPSPQSVVVSNVPSTCMVLANWLLDGDHPELGPHPVVMGADRLQWNDIHPDTIDHIRISFGIDPVGDSEFSVGYRAAKVKGIL